MRTPIRPFRHPAIWFALWAAMIVLVIALSLMRGPPIPDLLTIGKADHFIAYLALAVVAVQLFASRNAQVVAALALVGLGIGLEFAQGYLTTWRDMSVFDGCIDTVGVLAGMATSWTPVARALLRIEGRLVRG